MRIISKFKDYYDFIADINGGGDPKIVYVRNRAERQYCADKFDSYRLRVIRDINLKDGYSAKGLSIAGVFYVVIRSYTVDLPTGHYEYTPWRIYQKGESRLLDILTSGRRLWSTDSEVKYAHGMPGADLLAISKFLKTPVFTFHPNGQVEKDVPILKDLGLPSVIPPDQMYQNLSYFVGNLMQNSPDLTPTPNPGQTDKERALSHGFDAKISFRHRL